MISCWGHKAPTIYGAQTKNKPLNTAPIMLHQVLACTFLSLKPDLNTGLRARVGLGYFWPRVFEQWTEGRSSMSPQPGTSSMHQHARSLETQARCPGEPLAWAGVSRLLKVPIHSSAGFRDFGIRIVSGSAASRGFCGSRLHGRASQFPLLTIACRTADGLRTSFRRAFRTLDSCATIYCSHLSDAGNLAQKPDGVLSTLKKRRLPRR